MDLLKLNPFIDRIISYEKKSNLSELKKIIKENKYDFIVDFQNNIRSRILTLFIFTKIIRFNKHSFKKFFLVKTKLNFLKNLPRIYKRYFLTLNKLKLTGEKAFDDYIKQYKLQISFNVNTLEKRFEINLNDNIIGFCPSARHKTKIYPIDKFINIGKELLKNNNSTLLIFGSNEEYEYCEQLRKGIDNDKCINLSGKTSIIETSVLISKCKLIITNDTGLMHLADLINTPLIAIFGSTVRELGFYPFGENSYIIENNELKCRPCSHIGLDKCPKKHFKCMKDIEETKIINIAYKILNNIN